MSKIIDGKKPITEKKSGSLESLKKLFRNKLDLDERLVTFFSSKGLDCRFINYKTFADQGFHSHGWEIYQPSKHGSCDGFETFYWGQNPDGIIKRGDAVLAVRQKEISAEHRALLREKSDRLSNYNRRAAKELRQQVKDSNIKAEIHEGYDEND
jgi:hypothetical protein